MPPVPPTDQYLTQLARETPLSLRVTGSCMAPLIQDGQRVRIEPRRLYLPGDILVFRAADGRLLCHRLLGYFPRNGRIHCLCQSDNGRRPDGPIPYAHILGRVDLAAPFRARLEQRARALGRLAAHLPRSLGRRLGLRQSHKE
jgi:hypothetical protein